MSRFSPRHYFGIVTVLALIAIGYALLRPQHSLSVSPSVRHPASPSNAAPAEAHSVTSKSGPGEWAMEGYNPARTRAVSTGITLPVTRQRAVQVLGDDGAGSPVAVAGNTMLVETNGHLRALDLASGKERWSFAQVGHYISPAVAQDTVFIRAESGNKGQLFALDLATGTQRWAFRPRRLSSAETNFWGGHLTSPVVVDGVVFVGAGKELYALDAATGMARWEYSGDDYVFSSATVGDGRVFISGAEHLYAVDQTSGALVWKSPIDLSIYFAPIVADETVFLTNGAKLLALRTADGAKRWETSLPGQKLIPGAVQGSRIFAKSMSTLFALDLTSGKEIWRSDHPNFVSLPAIAGEQIFAVTGGVGHTQLAVLDATTGKEVWKQSVPTLASAAPVIAGETVYVRTTDGRVLGLSH